MHNIFVLSFDMSSHSLMSLTTDIFFSASEKNFILFMYVWYCWKMINFQYYIIIILFPITAKSAAFTPSPSCSLRYVSSVPIFDFFPTRQALYIGMSMLSWHVHRQVLKLSWWVRLLCAMSTWPRRPQRTIKKQWYCWFFDTRFT